MKYIIICGPTCSGKTGLGIDLALRYKGEIISADSRQIYKHTTIGTAKPKPEKCRGVKHHLINFLELDENFSAYKFAEVARKLIKTIINKHKLPLVVGGTGLYLKALTEGLFESPEPDTAYRQELRKKSDRYGPEILHEMLEEVDPEAANRITAQDEIRLIRALETYELTGKPITEMHAEGEHIRFGSPLWVGLMPERKILYNSINKRVDDMIDEGLEQEVLQLEPYLDILRKKKMVGYTDLISYLFDKKLSRDEAIEKVKQHHRNYAKRQITWFKKVKQINWFDPNSENYKNEIDRICDKFLEIA